MPLLFYGADLHPKDLRIILPDPDPGKQTKIKGTYGTVLFHTIKTSVADPDPHGSGTIISNPDPAKRVKNCVFWTVCTSVVVPD